MSYIFQNRNQNNIWVAHQIILLFQSQHSLAPTVYTFITKTVLCAKDPRREAS